MREFTQDRSHSFAHSRIVESNSQLKGILLTTQEGTKMKDLTNAPSATQNLWDQAPSRFTFADILARNPMAVIYVESDFLNLVTWELI